MDNDEILNPENQEDQDQTAYGYGQSSEEPLEESGETGPGVSKAKVTVKKGDEMLFEFEIENCPVRIGRKSDNDIVLEEKNVSRKHAEIIMKDNQYVISDLQSTGGLKVNGERVTEKDIHTGDVIGIGNYSLHFDSGIPEDERTVFETDEQTILEEGTVIDEDRTRFYEEPEAKLVVIKSEACEEDIVLKEEEVVIGRDEDADVTIEDDRLSRKHCKIAQVGGQFVISDLNSSNGTFVNGVKVTEKTLENNDKIQIGSNVLQFKVEKAIVPQKKGGIKVFAKIAVAILVLAAVVFAIYQFVPGLRQGEPQKVILQKAWEYPTRGVVAASPSLGDLNGDGYINIVAADMAGTVYALDGRQGGLIWNSVFQSGGGAVRISPLLADINEQDGELDVIVGTSTKGVLTIDGGTMRTIWLGQIGSAVSAPLAAADINNDGTEDLFAGTANGTLICLDGRQGGPLWRLDTGASIESGPILVDLNEDGVSDLVIGSTNNKIYCLDGKTGRSIWIHTEVDRPSTIASADFNHDGRADLVFATPSRLVILEGQKGSVLWSWSVPESARPTESDPFHVCAPAVSDLNGDKEPDVVLSTSGGHVYAVDGASRGTAYIWDYGLTAVRKTGPALSDLNGDGTMDVVIGDAEGNVIVIDGATGYQLNNLNVGDGQVSVPVIGDFTSNETADIVVSVQNKIIAIQTETPVKLNQIIWNSR
ncbi:FHA domain-containing protein [bacterium]|nr:FHA domain-containing protein [bacterium]